MERASRTVIGQLGRGRVAGCLCAWILTAAVGAWSVSVDVMGKENELRDLAITVLASVLFALLYFLSKWVRDVIKPIPLPGALVNCWLAFVCSIIVCLTGALAFGVRSCWHAKQSLGDARPGWLAWLAWFVPSAYVFAVGAGLIIMLVGLLRWYLIYLRDESISAQQALGEDALNLVRWRTYFDYAILVFVGMGITALCWMLSGDAIRIAAALGHILSLLFGLFGVGLYATSLDCYLPMLRERPGAPSDDARTRSNAR